MVRVARQRQKLPRTSKFYLQRTDIRVSRSGTLLVRSTPRDFKFEVTKCHSDGHFDLGSLPLLSGISSLFALLERSVSTGSTFSVPDNTILRSGEPWFSVPLSQSCGEGPGTRGDSLRTQESPVPRPGGVRRFYCRLRKMVNHRYDSSGCTGSLRLQLVLRRRGAVV